jgi:hypothetical protein
MHPVINTLHTIILDRFAYFKSTENPELQILWNYNFSYLQQERSQSCCSNWPMHVHGCELHNAHIIILKAKSKNVYFYWCVIVLNNLCTWIKNYSINHLLRVSCCLINQRLYDFLHWMLFGWIVFHGLTNWIISSWCQSY